MKKNESYARSFSWYLTVARVAVLFALAGAQSSMAVQPTTDHATRYLSLEPGQVSLIRFPGVHRVAIGDPKVVSYKTVDEDSVLLVASGKGKSNVHIWGDGDRQVRYWVSVGQRTVERDLETARALLKGIERISIYPLDDKVVVQGEISEPEMVRVQSLQKLLPDAVIAVTPRRLIPARTVRIDALLVEVSTGDLHSIGIDWADSMSGPAVGFHKTFQSDNRFLIYEKDPDGINEGIVSTFDVGDRSFFSYFGITSHLLSRINLLSEAGRATILTAPKLTTLDGQEARFQVGGQFPIPFIDSNGALTVERQDYGVLLNVTPVVDGDLISMNVKVELSDIDRSVQVNGVPGLKRRNTETSVQLRNNETVAISGLFQVDESQSDSKVPFLGDVPVIKKFFSSENSDNKDRQVVVLITPKLITAGDSDDRAMSRFAREHLRTHQDRLTIDQSLME